MAIEVETPHNKTITIEDGAKFERTASGTLEIRDADDTLVAEFAAGHWAYVGFKGLAVTKTTY